MNTHNQTNTTPVIDWILLALLFPVVVMAMFFTYPLFLASELIRRYHNG